MFIAAPILFKSHFRASKNQITIKMIFSGNFDEWLTELNAYYKNIAKKSGASLWLYI